MKNKIIFTLILMLILSCLFVISIGAEVTTYEDAPEKTNIEVSVNDVVVFDDGFSCPSAYIFKDQTNIPNGSHSTPGLAHVLDFNYINGKTEKIYGIDNIVELDIPEGIETIGTFVAYNRKTLKRITIPYSVTSVGGVGFQNASNLEECVFEKGGNPALTTFETYMFSNCSSLKAFSMPDSITKIAGKTQFAGCSNLTALHLSNSLTTIECGSQNNATFDGCKKLYFVNEPFTTSDTAPQKPTVYYFPSNFSTISNQCVFRNCTSLNDVIVFGESLTSIPCNYTFQHSPANTMVFLGDMTNVDATYWGTSTIYFANEADKSASDIATLKGAQTKYYCNAEGNTTHLAEKTVEQEAKCELDAAKITYCFCGQEMSKDVVEGSALSHDYDYKNNANAKLISIVYSNYNANGEKTVCCANCGNNAVLEVLPLFTSQGYSAKIMGGNGFALGYAINRKAMKEYTEFNGESLSYGFFAVLEEKLGTNDVIKSDGTFANGVIKNDMTNRDFDIIEFKITGFTTEEQMTKQIVSGIYVLATKENETKVSCLQVGTPNGGEGYLSISYRDLVPLS